MQLQQQRGRILQQFGQVLWANCAVHHAMISAQVVECPIVVRTMGDRSAVGVRLPSESAIVVLVFIRLALDVFPLRTVILVR
jgi:hypothetical protein